MIKGCTTSTACNYNSEAKEDDNSCIDPLGCDNWCPGDTTEVKELDCAGVCGGLLFIDCTGQCGILVVDECGVCGGNNAICTDCHGVVNGDAFIDPHYNIDDCKTNECVGGNTGLEACNYDCTGIWGGDAEMDQCGVCAGDNSTCTDCNGDINGTAYIDGCEKCVGGETGGNECTTDCTGLLGGTSFYDNCGICVPEEDTSCVQSCTGIWVNDGSQLVFDDCNVCGGDNTVCAGCDGIPNSGLEIDVCGICGGDGNCEGVDCTDDNESGYCRDLSVLQEFIDNSSGTLNMDMDDNGDGVIEPLELGEHQTWINGRLTEFSCWWVIDSNSETCQLSGEIPSEIGNLTSLTILYLSYNQLSGKIPSEIGSLTSLTYLGLNNNQLTGEIPSEIGNLTSLTVLLLDQNQLTGEIPSELGNLTSLSFLYLRYNELTGEIPSWIGNLTSLTRLYLHNNQLTGEIPEEIGNLTSLNYLGLSDNQLAGEIPSWIGNLTSLNYLGLSDNQLTGEIPEEICNQGDSSPSLSNNQLCPPYPSCLTEEDIGYQDISECSATVTDSDGNTYGIVQIGDQIWMAENLKVTHYNNGDEISNPNNDDWGSIDEGQYAVYDNDPSNTDIYGNLYNFAVVDDDRGVCPVGFHVPSDEEWIALEMFLGMSEEETNIHKSNRGTNEGSKLAGNSDLWDDGDLENNSEFGTSGFNALPGGNRNNGGGDVYMGHTGYFWSSTGYNSGWAALRELYSGNSGVGRFGMYMKYGFNIRCVLAW